jgi:signal transduction histidine kinase
MLDKNTIYFRYGLAIVAVAVSVCLRFAVESQIPWGTPWAFFAVAILVAARFGGFGPGLLATALSTIAAKWFFHAWHTWRAQAMLNVAILDAAGVAMSLLCGQLRNALEKSLEQQRRFEGIIAAAPGVIYRFAMRPDGSTAVPFATSALRDIYGIEPAQVESDASALIERIHPADRGVVLACLAESKTKMSVFRKEFRVLNPEKGELWVENRSVPVQESDGSCNWFGFSMDVTARMQLQLAAERHQQETEALNATLEQRVRERTAQLEAANRELESFSYSVSHDLRSPLRGIDGWSVALLEEYGRFLDERGRSYLERVRAETRRMGFLIEDLIKLSRVTRSEMRPQPVDLTAMATRIANGLGETSQGTKGPRQPIEFDIAPGLRAFGDPRLLEIALSNLLENAVKFTAKQPRPRICFAPTQRDGKPAFYVKDNGAGFDPRHSGALFGAFQRLHKESEFPGSGIGLATVKRVIQRHGGDVWAEGEVGVGATFGFSVGLDGGWEAEAAGS